MIELFFFYINININKLNNIFYLNYYLNIYINIIYHLICRIRKKYYQQKKKKRIRN